MSAAAAAAAVAAANTANTEAKKKLEHGNCAGPCSESRLLLSTTYSLNASDTKRVQVGLRRTGEAVIFKPAVKLLGNTASGIHFDADSWTEFKAHMEDMGSYLRMTTGDTPVAILLKSGIVVNFTSAYGARAIMVALREKTLEDSTLATTTTTTTTRTTRTTTAMSNPREDSQLPPTKKRKIYSPCIVMQRVSFEGLANVVKCIDAKCDQLQTLVNSVNDCTRFLITEIELNLPKDKNIYEDLVKSTLTGKYAEIEANVRRQISDLQFLDFAFNIIFNELAAVYLHDISQCIIRNVSL